jgi:hypothetical protein
MEKFNNPGSNPAAGMAVCECCVLSGAGVCGELTTHSEYSADCGVPECDREASIRRRPWLTRDCCAMQKILTLSEEINSMHYAISRLVK